MKELYAYWLRSQCEYWLNENHETIYRLHYLRLPQSALDESGASFYAPLSQIQLETGPWKSMCFQFKEPGEPIHTQEQSVLKRLRDEGHRVMIVRHLEDFKTLLQTYLPVSSVQEEPAPIYSRKSA